MRRTPGEKKLEPPPVSAPQNASKGSVFLYIKKKIPKRATAQKLLYGIGWHRALVHARQDFRYILKTKFFNLILAFFVMQREFLPYKNFMMINTARQ